ncbi:MAG: hypothetical protein J9259_06705 [Thermoplasmata archaeon YP2-bin.285]|uniref:Uncharacterized protein n=1 Tax=Candidatus Sysuiplasma superficiale TaxID=2823368 RepID=A0A8J8CBJ8_9ARCH|nr:hypothetical protein [Candidatus Sysuiplasma superficiale]
MTFSRIDYSSQTKLFAGMSAIVLSLLLYWYTTRLIAPTFSQLSSTPVVLSALLAVVFWLAVSFVTFEFFFRNDIAVFVRLIKEKWWAPIFFAAYLTIHLLVYGLVLENILVLTFGSPGVVASQRASAFIFLSNAFYPHTIGNALLQITLNPSFEIVVPPYYGLVLGPFSFYTAAIIGVLVILHINRLSLIRGAIRRVGGSIVYPAVGVVGGASCCISLPVLITEFTPIASGILIVPMWVDLLNALYYLLPISVMVALYAGLGQLSYSPKHKEIVL